MGISLIGELKPIPWTDREKLPVVVHWITQHVPCFVGKIPAEYTDEVVRELRKRRVPDSVIAAALLYLRNQGTYVIRGHHREFTARIHPQI